MGGHASDALAVFTGVMLHLQLTAVWPAPQQLIRAPEHTKANIAYMLPVTSSRH